MNTEVNKLVWEFLSEAGLSHEDISGLLAKSPVERTKELVSMYSTRSSSTQTLKIISVVHYIGDLQLTGDFYADILQTGNPEEKFNAAVHAEFDRYKEHHRLREALKNHLRGSSVADSLIQKLGSNRDR